MRPLVEAMECKDEYTGILLRRLFWVGDNFYVWLTAQSARYAQISYLLAS
jgi:hypothetical protein